MGSTTGQRRNGGLDVGPGGAEVPMMETRCATRPERAPARFSLRRGWAFALPAAALWLGAAAVAAQAERGPGDDAAMGDGPWLTLPDEPMGRAWASVSETTAPWLYLSLQAPPPPDAVIEPWASWADALQKVAGKAAPAARREAAARLMGFAAKDGRPEDAYAWAKTLGAGDPAGVAGTLPYLFPGVPFGARLLEGGRPAPLPDGTLLSPILAAPRAADAPMGIVWREAKARGLEVGGATFDMELKIDNTGVVVDFEAVSGTESKLRLSLPSPEGYRLKALFVDWEKVPLPKGANALRFDWSKVPIDVVLKERDSTYSIFARIAPLTSSLPTSPKVSGGLPDALLEGGLEIRIAPGDSVPWDAITKAWAKAAGVQARTVVAVPGGPAAPAAGVFRGVRGTVLDFARSPDPARLRRQITAAIEARIRSGS